MKIHINRRSAFTLTEIMVVAAIIGFLAVIGIPNFVKARATAQQTTCKNNLRQLESAKEQWAFAKRCGTGDNVNEDELPEYLKHNAMPQCPANGSYTVGTVGESVNCDVVGEAPHVLDPI